MTEKNYGGSTSHGLKNNAQNVKQEINNKISSKSKTVQLLNNNSTDNLKDNYNDFIKAGQISIKVKEFARALIKPGMPLLEIVEKIESEIIKLGAKPAFPTNIAINDIAAH